MNLREATIGDIRTIQAIADIAFRETYKPILSEDQLVYMLDMMYSTESLEKQLSAGQVFILLSDGGRCIGFASYEADCPKTGIVKLHKLYLLPETKGKGYGRVLVDAVFECARILSARYVRLNMNRNNTSYTFYTHMGFEVIGSEDIDIGDGFLMEDYIFEKKI